MIKKITVESKGGPREAAKHLRKAHKKAWASTVMFWHDHYLEDHFKASADRKYNYKPRSRRYKQKKRGRFGHANPLLKTGRMRRELRRSISVTSTSKRGTGVMSGPFYIDPDPESPNYPAEIVATTEAEAERLADHFMSVALRDLDRNRRVERVTI